MPRNHIWKTVFHIIGRNEILKLAVDTPKSEVQHHCVHQVYCNLCLQSHRALYSTVICIKLVQKPSTICHELILYVKSLYQRVHTVA